MYKKLRKDVYRKGTRKKIHVTLKNQIKRRGELEF